MKLDDIIHCRNIANNMQLNKVKVSIIRNETIGVVGLMKGDLIEAEVRSIDSIIAFNCVETMVETPFQFYYGTPYSKNLLEAQIIYHSF